MTAEFDSGAWASDALLSWVLDNLDTFWWQSHTLSHLARDNLGQSDCTIEDGGEREAEEGCLYAFAPFRWQQRKSQHFHSRAAICS